jgi:[acyl-carrier-protein] S-malonyltransferase
MTLAREAGAKRALALNVSGAFHSPLMAPAADRLKEHLEQIDFRDPVMPVFSNATAQPVTTGAVARDLLVRQLTAPVRWSASIAGMVELGVDSFLELGPGSVLTGLNRRIAKGLPCTTLGDPDQLVSWTTA